MLVKYYIWKIKLELSQCNEGKKRMGNVNWQHKENSLLFSKNWGWKK